MINLPIDTILPSLRETLAVTNSAVLIASPGAGKTTRVPLALINEPWLAGKKVLMLEPRRLAARAAARYMAGLLNEAVGNTIGYRVRKDTRVGSTTRVEVITEGVLTRMLQSDPALEGVGVLILDEFHERSIQADLGLALALQSQSLLRPELRILIMSATLEAEPVASLLGGAPVLISEGRQFPVETHYLESQPKERLEAIVIRAIQKALSIGEDDILVFLPGVGEIRRVMNGLQQTPMGGNILIAPLYGSLSYEEQDRAIAPSPEGYRKIVLATSIAETSLTVEGVRIVIDSGLMRVPKFSPRTGMTRLTTVAVSRSSAEQRRGRAGRLGRGVCFRLWTQQEDAKLVPRGTPEILETDLTSLALELAVWGVHNPEELCWVDIPPCSAVQQARELLIQLGALAADGTVTAHGRQMAQAAIHPRLAHMIIKAKAMGLGGLACELAAILNERDILSASGRMSDADLRHRLQAISSETYRNVRHEADFLKKEFNIQVKVTTDEDMNNTGILLAFAYPDRIAQRREDGRYLMRNGRGALLSEGQLLSHEPYLVAAELDDRGTDSRIFLAAPFDLTALKEHFSEQIETITLVRWERDAQAVRAKQQERLGSIVIRESVIQNPRPDQVLSSLLQGIREEGLGILPWTRAATQLVQRIRFMRSIDEEWPDVSEDKMRETVDDWLAPYLQSITGRSGLQQINLVHILEAMLTWKQRQKLEADAPTHILVPSGQRIPIDYSCPDDPILAVRLQEMFGLEDTPRIGGGRIPLILHLLSPARRPVQVTKDLASFWRNGYFEVRKDLLGRYPKHYWPDNPLTAIPTHRTKPRT